MHVIFKLTKDLVLGQQVFLHELGQVYEVVSAVKHCPRLL